MQKHQTIIYHQSIWTPDLWAVSGLRRKRKDPEK